MVIQNYDSIFLDFTTAKREAFFPVERFSKDRVVDYIFINPNFNGMAGNMGDYYPPAFCPDGSPLMEINLSWRWLNSTFEGFVDVSSPDKTKLLEAVPIRHLACSRRTGITPINSPIDPSLSKVRFYPNADMPYVDGNPVTHAQMNIGVIYCNKEKHPTDVIFRSMSFPLHMTSDDFRVKFKTFTRYGIKGKEIKKIAIRGDYDPTYGRIVPTDKWITIKTFNGRDIYQLSSGFLCNHASVGDGFYDQYYQRDLSDVFFDDLKIDEDNSFIENPSHTEFNGVITFYY